MKKRGTKKKQTGEHIIRCLKNKKCENERTNGDTKKINWDGRTENKTKKKNQKQDNPDQQPSQRLTDVLV